MKTCAIVVLFGSTLLFPACGGAIDAAPAACAGVAPSCVAPSGCDAPTVTPATCDEATSAWTCPAGAHPYASAVSSADEGTATCLPFHEAGGAVTSLGGSLVRVPIDDGRCLWVAEQVTTSAGASVRNVGFEPDLSAPFGACPGGSPVTGGAPASVVTLTGADGQDLLVQIDGGYRVGGVTRVFYRLFATDASAVFGVTELGSGLGAWDPASSRIVVAGPASLDWKTNLDLGDATRVVDGVPYAWGCHAPAQFLTNSCSLARLDANGGAELFAGASGWVPDQDVAEAATAFDSGPWIASVTSGPASAGFVHVYAVGFGGTLETHVAPAVTGPWTRGPTLAACDLPSADGHSFCAGPVVHEELADPRHPGQAVVSYGVGTTATNQAALLAAHPEDYWTRLAWVTLP